MTNSSKSSQRILALKHKQRIVRTNILAFTKYLAEYQDSTTERITLRDRVERLKNHFDIFNDAQNELGQYEDFDRTEADREAVTTLYDHVRSKAIQLLEGFQLTQTQTSRIATNSPAPSTCTNSTGVHLPKINLPRFDGRLEKWLTFKDAFTSLIQGHSGLTDIQKFQYLRLSVSGKAQAAIESFTMTEENYKAAWALMLETYDNQRALILRHTSLLLDTPAMPDNSPDAITDLINHMQSHLRSLESLGRSREDISNDILTSIAINRMTNDTRQAWEQTLTDTRMPHPEEIFKHLRNASHRGDLHTTVTSARQTRQTTRENQKSTPNRQFRAPKRAWNSTTTRREDSSSPTPKKRIFVTTTTTQTCPICHATSHQTYGCRTLLRMSIDDRWAAVRIAKLCQNCLQPRHDRNDCTRGRCRFCGQQHNSMLHKETNSAIPDKKA